MKNKIISIIMILMILQFSSMFGVIPGYAQEEEEWYWNVEWGVGPLPPEAHWNPIAGGRHMGIFYFDYEPLAYWLPQNGSGIPCLAVNWTYDADACTLTVKLRKGVKFHDGTELTSRDVEGTFWLARHPSPPGFPKGYIKQEVGTNIWEEVLDKIEIIDKYTLKFYYRKHTAYNVPWTLVTYILPYSVWGKYMDRMKELWQTTPVNETAIKEVAEEVCSIRPETDEEIRYWNTGTSPWVYKSWHTDRVVFTKFKDYWAADKVPYAGCIMWRVPLEISFTRMMKGGRESEAFDRWYGKRTWLEEFSKHPDKFKFVTIPMNYGRAFYFACDKYPTSELAVRRAIAYAINRTALTLANEWLSIPCKEYPGTQLFPDFVEKWIPKEWLAKMTKYEYNTTKAAEILTEAGWRKENGWWVNATGARLELDVLALYKTWCEMFAAELEAFGIKVNLIPTTGPEYWKAMDEGRFGHVGFRLWGRGIGPLGDPWRSFYEVLPIEGSVMCPGGRFPLVQEVPTWVDPSGKVNITEYMEKLKSATTFEEQQKYVKVIAWILNERMPVLDVCLRAKKGILNIGDYTGFEKLPDGDPVWSTVTVGGHQFWIIHMAQIIKPKALVPVEERIGGIEERIGGIKESVTLLGESVTGLKESVTLLGESVKSVEASVASLSTIAYIAIAVEVIVMILVAAVLVKKH